MTERLIGAHELALMKPTALLTNTARGAYVTREGSEALASMSMKSVCELLLEGREPEYVVRP